MPTVSKEERVVRDATAPHFRLDGGVVSRHWPASEVVLSRYGVGGPVRGTSKSARSARHTSRYSVPSPVA